MAKSNPEPLRFSCTCGSLCGHISPKAAKAGTRVVCHCPDCRAAALYHGCPDPAELGGADLMHLSPDAVIIDQGAEHLRLMQLSPKGLYRWYADCCNTPLLATPRSPKLPLVSMRSAIFEEPDRLGKVVAEAFVPQRGKPPRHKGAGRLVFQLASRMISAWSTGRWKNNPFFDSTSGTPIATSTVLSKEQRSALTRP
ncbi:DUF6151 family protein [Phaeobacter sp. HF9A]|uniref:DUF6151 family protein n=1 Tax=Phaeobacter sp. HF9A TaxID=2721561 RepID=UPI001431540B|nr:DUF6151 family protein [Phaeobacter sp. HF9A]NIZ15095.1 hypothetical protein [Phaeobacter sp. HF9A]